IPQIRRVVNLIGHLLCLLHYLLKVPLQSSVEGCTGDSLFWPRPNRFVLVGIAVVSRRRAGHGPILHGGILFLAGMPSLQEWSLSRDTFNILFLRLHVRSEVKKIVHRMPEILWRGPGSSAPQLRYFYCPVALSASVFP